MTFGKNTLKKIKEQNIGKVYKDNNITIDSVPDLGQVDSYESLVEECKKSGVDVKFQNKFLKIITNKRTLKNWVDIEQEYYNQLKYTLESDESIEDLNRNFKEIQDLLVEYLDRVKEENITLSDGLADSIFWDFKLKNFSPSFVNLLVNSVTNHFAGNNISEYNEFSTIIKSIENLDDRDKEDCLKDIRSYLMQDRALDKIDLYPNRIIFLNFNYTHICWEYISYFKNRNNTNTSIDYINIHGSLTAKEVNPIIFGFGDEHDESYSKIENHENQCYVENIKSLKYALTDNYWELLDFVENDRFQVLILGHSCGIADRTLLKTIFEHDNCVSIKPYYFKNDEGVDNFQDIINNISRNFTNKAMMRAKVLNKKRCECF